MLFNILALISLLGVILLLKRLVNVWPSLMACLIRWKESVNLEASVKLSRDRDMLAVAMTVPFLLVAVRFHMYDPHFVQVLPENARIGVLAAVFTAYLLLRTFTLRLFRPHKMNKATYDTACKAAWTFFIILTLLLLAIGSIMDFAGAGADTIQSAMIWISACLYMLFLFRKTQIFVSSCTVFTAFLYLCALEIVPTGILVVSAVIF